MLFVLTANWIGQEENVRVVIEADTKEEALNVAVMFYPGIHVLQCFEVHSMVQYRSI